MNIFFSPLPMWQSQGLAIIRIVIGLFLIYHGAEIFDSSKMNEYLKWDMFKNTSSGVFRVYAGKAAELAAGLLMTAGLLTRLASLIIIVTFLYISIFIGQGKIWYEDQHPFLFMLFGFVFLFTGGGRWSIDNLLFNKMAKQN
jgi:uncharacterized membrane protein YphA (DoxX/SURF4 family)